jgi:hypothetical protein
VIEPVQEAPRPEGGEAAYDALAFSFGDLEAARFGLVRLALEGTEARRATALAALLDAEGAVAQAQANGEPVEAPVWEALEVAGVQARVVEPLRAWHVRLAGEGGGFELEFEALAAPVSLLAGDDRLAGYEQPCRVSGTVWHDGARQELRCLGQRSREWGALGGDGVEVRRWIGAWFDPHAAVLTRAVRPAGGALDDELVDARLLEGDPPAPVEVADARLSTEYGPDGYPRRAGVELWLAQDDEYPRRGAGQTISRTAFDLGAGRLDCAFLHWRMEGRSGAGRYEILRAA